MNPETLLQPENLTPDSEKEGDLESSKFIETTKKFFGDKAIIDEVESNEEVVLFIVGSEVNVDKGNQDKIDLQVTGGYRRGNPDYFIVTGGTIEYQGNTFSLSQVLPEEAQFFLSEDGNYVRTYEDGLQVVNVESLESLESLFTLFHELGHIHDDKRHSGRERINCDDDQRNGSKSFLTQYEPDKAESLLVSRAESERGAWAQGFAMAKKLGLPLEIRKEMMKDAAECLSTYDFGIALSKFNRGSRYASSELQRESKKPEKQELKRFLDETIDRLGVIEDKIRHHTGNHDQEIKGELMISQDKLREYSVCISSKDSSPVSSVSMTERMVGGFEHSYFIVSPITGIVSRGKHFLRNGKWEKITPVDSRFSFIEDRSVDLQELERAKEIVNEILDNLEGKDSDVIDVIIVHNENFLNKRKVDS